MPTFPLDQFDIDAEEFITSCSSTEIKELIQYLIDEEYIKPNSTLDYDTSFSIPEQDFEDALNKLHGKYTTLSTEEEEIIKSIAKRF
jgi:hypothetical protein